MPLFARDPLECFQKRGFSETRFLLGFSELRFSDGGIAALRTRRRRRRGAMSQPSPTQAVMVTPARETMEREPILYNVVRHEAEAAAFQKKLVGEYKLKPFNPFTCVYCLFCCTLTGSYTISDASDDKLKLHGNTHVACCGCIPLAVSYTHLTLPTKRIV